MEYDPNPNQAMLRQFKANLPKNKLQVLETLDKLLNDPSWLIKVKSEAPQQKKFKKVMEVKTMSSE